VPAAPADRNPAVLLGPGGCRASWTTAGLGRSAASAVAAAAAVDGAGALALLLVTDGLALCGGVLLMVTTGTIPGSN
jgi:hypothetical protein